MWLQGSKLMPRHLWTLAFLCLGAAPLHAAGCPAERARYTQSDTRDFTAAFVRAGRHGTAASNLFFVVHSSRGSHWFRFNSANGYGRISLEAIPDPAGSNPQDGPQPIDASSDSAEDGDAARDSTFIPYRANLTEIMNPPQAGGNAPPVIVLPDLGARLWYDTSGSTRRLHMSRTAFRLSGCDGGGKARPQRR